MTRNAMDERFLAGSLEIDRGSEADIPSIEPLWVAVHHIHEASMPELAPYVTDDETWRERRALYAELFRKPETFLFLARVGGGLVGYALGHVLGSAESWWGDTWRVGDRVGELESVSCSPSTAARGSARRYWTPWTPSSGGSASTIRW